MRFSLNMVVLRGLLVLRLAAKSTLFRREIVQFDADVLTLMVDIRDPVVRITIPSGDRYIKGFLLGATAEVCPLLALRFLISLEQQDMM